MATLELYVIRHGLAAERGEDYPDDSKRPLTSAGIARLRKEAKALDGLDVSFDHIITSPLVRTKQTADVFAETMKSKPSVSTSDSLAPAGTPAAVIQELGKHMRKGRIALVGHEPNIGRARRAPDRGARAADIQEGRDLPDRLRRVPTQRDRAVVLVHHAADAAAET